MIGLPMKAEVRKATPAERAEARRLARLRQADTVVGTIKQTGIELFLELADLEGHRRLGHMQFLGRLGKAQQPGHRLKYL